MSIDAASNALTVTEETVQAAVQSFADDLSDLVDAVDSTSGFTSSSASTLTNLISTGEALADQLGGGLEGLSEGFNAEMATIVGDQNSILKVLNIKMVNQIANGIDEAVAGGSTTLYSFEGMSQFNRIMATLGILGTVALGGIATYSGIELTDDDDSDDDDDDSSDDDDDSSDDDDDDDDDDDA